MPRAGVSWRAALTASLAAGAVPYGYTLTVWSTGAVLHYERGGPGPGAIVAFLAGAIFGFALISLLSRPHHALAMPPDEQARILAGALSLVATGLAFAAGFLLAHVDSFAAWPLASFAATVIYLVAASAQLAFASRRADRPATKAAP